MSASHNVVEAIGFTAATLTTVALVPQLVRVWRLRSAREISLGMFLMFSVGVTLWLIYGLAVHAMPVVLANAVTLVLSLAILGLKLRFDSHATDKDQPDGAPR